MSRLPYSRSVLLFFICIITGTALAQDSDSSFRVDSIQISGNRKTKASIIIRELSFRSGDTVQNWTYHREQSRRQLINLFLFNEIDISRSGNTVLVHVTERWYIWPIPELDYADRNFNQWWLTRDPKRLIYGVNLEWYNVRGRNETMVLSLVAGYTRMAAVSYRIPYFNRKQTWGMQVSAHYNNNREVWHRTENDKVQFFRDRDRSLISRKGAELVLTHRRKIFNYHHFYSGYRQISVDDTVNSFEVNRRYLMFNANRQDEWYGAYQFVHDRRDYKGFPLKGNMFRVTAENSLYFRQGEALSKNFHTLMLKASWSKYMALSEKWFLSGHLTGRYFSNPAPPYSRVQALGYGKDYIRGYELNVTDGSHFGLVKSEVKYRFHNRKYRFMPKVRNYELLPVSLFLSAFFDAGYVYNRYEKENPGSNLLPNSLQNGGGAGLNLVLFYDYCMRIEYSFNRKLDSRFYVSFVAAM